MSGVWDGSRHGPETESKESVMRVNEHTAAKQFKAAVRECERAELPLIALDCDDGVVVKVSDLPTLRDPHNVGCIRLFRFDRLLFKSMWLKVIAPWSDDYVRAVELVPGKAYCRDLEGRVYEFTPIVG